MTNQPKDSKDASLDGSGDDSEFVRTRFLVKYESWMQWLARREINARFQGKFSASDVVQQTMFEAWKDWDQFRGEDESQRRVWLRKILAHQIGKLVRQFGGTQKRDVSREMVMQSLAHSDAELVNILPAAVSSPSRKVIEEEQQLEVAEALEKLPDDYREVIELRHMEGLSHAEIALKMRRNEGAVRILWVRALAKLKENLES